MNLAISIRCLFHEASGVILNFRIQKRALRVISPPYISAASMTQYTYKCWLVGSTVLEFLGHHVVEQTEIIGIHTLYSTEVVHGKIPKDGNRTTLERLKTDDGKVRVFRSGFAGNIIPVTPSMHRSPHRGITEGVIGNPIGSFDPASKGRVFICVKYRRAHSRWFEIVFCSIDSLHNPVFEKRRVTWVHIRTKTPHTGRCGMGVSCTDKHAVRTYTGLPAGC